MNMLVMAGTMAIPGVADWIARVQIIPAALSLSLTTIALWIIVSLFFGRIYCSVICPLGVFQDVVARVARVKRRWRLKRGYRYRRPKNVLRVFILGITLVTLVGGLSIFTTILDPYSIYTRFVLNWLQPAWALIVNGVTSVETLGIMPVKVYQAGIVSLLMSVLMILVAGVLAWRAGRLYCNTICPVGTFLGLFGRYSLMRIDINTDKCVQCRACEHVCKSSCINMIEHTVDMSRCVVCFDCLTACNNSAISYTQHRHRLSLPMMQRITPPGQAATTVSTSGSAAVKRQLDRRKFLTLGIVAAASTAIAKAEDVSQRIEAIETGAKSPGNLLPTAPPGARSVKSFLRRCTGCGLCISHCPTGVLRPSVTRWGIMHILHPVMDFERGACQYSCTRCSNLCPTGALMPLTVEEKHITRIGEASVIDSNCIHCGLCARRCPTEAITMVRTAGVMLPRVDTSLCIGCGECQYVCPATPYKAININGIR